MRGEYGLLIINTSLPWELPPRARRILELLKKIGVKNGTTSACAENTCLKIPPINIIGNYLRVRGEYLSSSLAAYTMLELPPRARRIQMFGYEDKVHLGTTSACAENTLIVLLARVRAWNYLRVRGEYPK